VKHDFIDAITQSCLKGKTMQNKLKMNWHTTFWFWKWQKPP